MSLASILAEAYNALSLSKESQDSTTSDAPKKHDLKSLEELNYDDLVHEVYHRKVNTSLVSTQDQDHVSHTGDFVQSSAEKAQAIVALDYFAGKFKAEKSVSEISDVNHWIEQTARNHTNFLYLLESEKRPDEYLHQNDEEAYMYSLDIENIPSYSELRSNYVSHNSSKYIDLLAQCAASKQACVDELNERLETCKHDQQALWTSLTSKLRAAISQITELREQHTEWGSKIAQANVTEQAVMKIIDDRFRVTFKQMKDYNVIQEEQIVEINSEMKKISRTREKLSATLQELHSDRKRPNNIACSRAKYLVQGIAKDIRIKEKKAGLSMAAKLRKNMESIESLREDGRTADDRLRMLQEQENSHLREFEQMNERVPRLRIAAREMAIALREQTALIQSKLKMVELIVAECGEIAIDNNISELPVAEVSSPQVPTPILLFGELPPMTNVDTLLRESAYVTNGREPEWDALSVNRTTSKGAQKGFKADLSQEEMIENICRWRKPEPGELAPVGVGSNGVGRRTILDIKPVEVSVRSLPKIQFVLSGLLAGCYCVFAAPFQREQKLKTFIRDSIQKFAAENAKEAANRRISQRERKSRFRPSQKSVSLPSFDPSQTDYRLNLDNQPPLELLNYSASEICFVMSKALETLVSLRIFPRHEGNKLCSELNDLFRRLKVEKPDNEDVTEELLTLGLYAVQLAIEQAPTPLLVRNQRALFGRFLLPLLAVSNILMELAGDHIRAKWLTMTEVFNVCCVDIERASLSLLNLLCGPTINSDPTNTFGMMEESVARDNLVDGNVSTLLAAERIMEELAEVCDDSEGSPGFNGYVFPNLQEAMQLSSVQLFRIIEIALKWIHSNPDPYYLPSVDFLDSIVRTHCCNSNFSTSSRNNRLQYRNIHIRNIVIGWQIFLHALSARDMSRYALLDMILRGVESGFRLVSAGRFEPLRSNEDEVCVFPFHDIMATMQMISPLLWPMFQALDIWRRVHELEIGRTNFLLQIARNPVLSNGLDLSYLGVAMASDVQMALVHQLPNLSQGEVSHIRQHMESLDSSRNSKKNHSTDWGRETDVGVVIFPNEFTDISSKDRQRNLLREESLSKSRAWAQCGQEYLNQLCDRTLESLWRLDADVNDAQSLTGNSRYCVPIHSDLKSRATVLVEKMRHLCCGDEVNNFADGAVKMNQLQTAFQQVLYDIVRCRSVVMAASNSFLEPWQAKSRWLRKQYQRLQRESDVSFTDVNYYRGAVAAVQEDINRYTQDIRKAMRKSIRRPAGTEVDAAQAPTAPTPAASVPTRTVSRAGTGPRNIDPRNDPRNANSNQRPQSVSFADKARTLGLQQKVDQLMLLRDSRMAHYRSLADMERVQLESNQAMRVMRQSAINSVILDTARRLRTMLIINDDNEEDDDDTMDTVRRSKDAEAKRRRGAVKLLATQIVYRIFGSALVSVIRSHLMAKVLGPATGSEADTQMSLTTARDVEKTTSSIREVVMPVVDSKLNTEDATAANDDGKDGDEDDEEGAESDLEQQDVEDRLAELIAGLNDSSNDNAGETNEDRDSLVADVDTQTRDSIKRETRFFSFLGDSEFKIFADAAAAAVNSDLVRQTKVKYFNANNNDEPDNSSEEANHASDEANGMIPKRAAEPSLVSVPHPHFGDAFVVNSFSFKQQPPLWPDSVTTASISPPIINNTSVVVDDESTRLLNAIKESTEIDANEPTDPAENGPNLGLPIVSLNMALTPIGSANYTTSAGGSGANSKSVTPGSKLRAASAELMRRSRVLEAAKLLKSTNPSTSTPTQKGLYISGKRGMLSTKLVQPAEGSRMSSRSATITVAVSHVRRRSTDSEMDDEGFNDDLMDLSTAVPELDQESLPGDVDGLSLHDEKDEFREGSFVGGAEDNNGSAAEDDDWVRRELLVRDAEYRLQHSPESAAVRPRSESLEMADTANRRPHSEVEDGDVNGVELEGSHSDADLSTLSGGGFDDQEQTLPKQPVVRISNSQQRQQQQPQQLQEGKVQQGSLNEESSSGRDSISTRTRTSFTLPPPSSLYPRQTACISGLIQSEQMRRFKDIATVDPRKAINKSTKMNVSSKLSSASSRKEVAQLAPPTVPKPSGEAFSSSKRMIKLSLSDEQLTS